MDIVTSIKTCYRKSLTFSGRASRSEFWWFVVAIFGFHQILRFTTKAIALWDSVFGNPAVLVLIVANLVTQIAWSAAAVRRLHDTDKSGWFLLGLFFVASLSISAAAQFFLTGEIMYLRLSGVFSIAAILVAIYLFSRPGTIGQNRFGVDPLQ